MRGIISLLCFFFIGLQLSAQSVAVFGHTGAVQTFIVPAGVTSIDIRAWGAEGGSDDAPGEYGGLGGYAEGTLSVNPGDILYINVGGHGEWVSGDTPSGGGFNGGGNARGLNAYRGGGGGATDVRLGSNNLSDRVIVAAGGGGNCGSTSVGGNGGGENGEDSPGGTGEGATQNSPGTYGCGEGQSGLGGSSTQTCQAAGGGGGFYGGSAGCGGGGGSGYIDGVTNGILRTGIRSHHGTLRLTYTIDGQIPNDICQDATPIYCGDVVTGNTVDASHNNPLECNAPNGNSGGLWYSFTGTGELVRFSTCNANTDFNTQISIYIGTCDELICIDGNDDGAGCSGGTSEIEIQTNNGTRYLIFVNGQGNAEGDFQLDVSCPQPNETCESPNTLNCGTTETGFLAGSGYGIRSLWYEFIGNDECVVLSTCSAATNVNTRISVFTGDCNNSTLETYNDNNSNCSFSLTSSEVRFVAEDGVRYLVRLSAAPMSFGEFELSVSCGPVPPLELICPEDITLACDAPIPAAAQNHVEFLNIGGDIIGGHCNQIGIEDFTVTSEDLEEGLACDGIHIERIYTLTSIQTGVTATCSQIINIAATPQPDIRCADEREVDCAENITPNLIHSMVVSDCSDDVIVTYGDPVLIDGTPNCPNAVYGVTFTATDPCGRTDECELLYRINDSELEINCQPDLTLACIENFDTIPYAPFVSTDCPIGYTIDASPPQLISGTPNCPGAIYEVVYFVTDECGRSATCSILINIANEGPAITGPPGFTVACAADIVVHPSDAIVTTYCNKGYNVLITGPKILIGGPNCPNTTYNYHYVVKDDCGSQAMWIRTFTIENDGPSITCQAGGNVKCIDEIPLDPGMSQATTSCGSSLQVRVEGPYLISGLGGCANAQYEVIYTANDNCGRSASCSTQYTIVNEGPQIIESAPDQIVECSFDIEAQPELIIATTDCDLGMNVTYSEPQLISGDGSCDGEYEIVYTVADDCGRTTEASQYFIIQNEAPRVIPPDPITISCLEELGTLDVNDAEIYSACNIPIVKTEIIGPTIDENEPLCNGDIINVLYSATDACGRMTCEPQIIFIQLDETTLANHFPNTTVECSEIPTALNANDLCGFEKLDYSDVEESLTADSYQILRTYTAEDGCAESFEYTQVITVNCGTFSPEKEYCTLNVKGWTDKEQISANEKFAAVALSEIDPLIIGEKGYRVLFPDIDCLEYILSEGGEASTFKHTETELYVNDQNHCGYELLNIDVNGYLQNALFKNMIALELNMRADKTFEDLPLRDICLDWDSKIIDAIGENPTIKGLALLGHKALATDIPVDHKELSESIEQLLEYFMGCRTATCDEPGVQNYIYQDAPAIDLPEFLLNLYPNPSRDFINIKVDSKKGQYTIQIFDAVGKVVYQNGLGEKIALSIDVRKWKTGLYHVGLTLNGALIKTEQLIIAQH